MDCLFCKIAAGEIPCARVYEDDDILAFRDIAPQAPIHILVIPKCHIASLDEVRQEHAPRIAALLAAIPEIARIAGLKNGYRLITNIGEDGRQSVKHLHFHILGGAPLPEEMGVG